jgi:signal transduction histidine kinase
LAAAIEPQRGEAGDAPAHGRRVTGLRGKIWIAFVLQVAAISLATVLGVYGASTVLKDVLIKRALTDEAGHFWDLLQRDPDTRLPDTYNMKGYLAAAGDAAPALPPEIGGLGLGFHALPRAQGGALVYVDERPQGRLYLIFKQDQVDRLAFLFGFVPLTVVLLIIYITAWLTYRVSRRAVSPVIWLAGVVRDWDPKHPDLAAIDADRLPADVDGDVQVLAGALHSFASRIEEFVERERNFTRDASHELRSPLTVIKVAADVMHDDGELSPYAQRSLERIRRSVRDMEALIESFLILAREDYTGLPEEDFLVNEVVREEVEKAEPLLRGRPVALRVLDDDSFCLHASPKVFSVMLSNLLRNACLYTEQGTVTVRIGADTVAVEDTGCGMSAEELEHAFKPFYRAGREGSRGHGIGLTIVSRLSERFGWPVELSSEPGQGTRATIRFPHPQPVE